MIFLCHSAPYCKLRLWHGAHDIFFLSGAYVSVPHAAIYLPKHSLGLYHILLAALHLVMGYTAGEYCWHRWDFLRLPMYLATVYLPLNTRGGIFYGTPHSWLSLMCTYNYKDDIRVENEETIWADILVAY